MRRQRRSFKLLSLLFCLTLVAAACGSDDDGGGSASDDGGASDQDATTVAAEEGGTVIFAGEQEPTGLNYMQSDDNAAWTQYVMQQVWPWVAIYQPDGEPLVNEEFVEVELTSEDPQVFEIHINEEAVWSDGTPITVADFVFTWESQNCTQTTGTDEEGSPIYLYNAAACNGYEDIESVEEGDSDKHVVVTFATPYADYISLFAPVLPAHTFAEAGDGDPAVGFNEGFKIENLTGDKLTDLVVSGGQFAVTDYQATISMTLERNEQYWGTPATLDRIIVPFITDATQQPAALENGEADIIFPQAQIDLVNQTQGIAGVTSFVGFGTFWEHMDFNEQNAHLADLAVRQAIGKALDRTEIVERLPAQFDDSAEVLNNRIYFPGDERYEPHGEEEYGTQDQEAARTLLEGAGYTEGADGLYAHPQRGPLNVRIVWRDPNPRRQQTAELVQAQLRESGIGITLDPRPDFTFLDAGDFDIALFGWTGGTVQSSNTSIYVPDGGQNYSKHNDPEIRELFDQANVELDPDARAELMNQIDQQIWEGLPTIPLFQVPEFLANVDDVANVIYNGYNGPSWNAEAWGRTAQ